jgi:Tfp pilus assembly protein PilF
MRNRMTQVVVLLMILALMITGCSSDEEKKASHLEKGKSYFEKGEYKSAELEFRNAIQIDPEFVDAYERLGETYLRLGDPRGPSGNTAWSPSSIRKTSMCPSSWPRFTCDGQKNR